MRSNALGADSQTALEGEESIETLELDDHDLANVSGGMTRGAPRPRGPVGRQARSADERDHCI
jgi:bacteriocin-like protein